MVFFLWTLVSCLLPETLGHLALTGVPGGMDSGNTVESFMSPVVTSGDLLVILLQLPPPILSP